MSQNRWSIKIVSLIWLFKNDNLHCFKMTEVHRFKLCVWLCFEINDIFNTSLKTFTDEFICRFDSVKAFWISKNCFIFVIFSDCKAHIKTNYVSIWNQTKFTSANINAISFSFWAICNFFLTFLFMSTIVFSLNDFDTCSHISFRT